MLIRPFCCWFWRKCAASAQGEVGAWASYLAWEMGGCFCQVGWQGEGAKSERLNRGWWWMGPLRTQRVLSEVTETPWSVTHRAKPKELQPS